MVWSISNLNTSIITNNHIVSYHKMISVIVLVSIVASLNISKPITSMTSIINHQGVIDLPVRGPTSSICATLWIGILVGKTAKTTFNVGLPQTQVEIPVIVHDASGAAVSFILTETTYSFYRGLVVYFTSCQFFTGIDIDITS